MRIPAGSIASITDLSSAVKNPKLDGNTSNFAAKLAQKIDKPAATEQIVASPEMKDLATKVASGQIPKEEVGQAFVDLIVAQNGGQQKYGSIAAKMGSSVGEIAGTDPKLSAKIYDALLLLHKELNK